VYLHQGLLHVEEHLHVTVHPGGVLEVKPTPGVRELEIGKGRDKSYTVLQIGPNKQSCHMH